MEKNMDPTASRIKMHESGAISTENKEWWITNVDGRTVVSHWHPKEAAYSICTPYGWGHRNIDWRPGASKKITMWCMGCGHNVPDVIDFYYKILSMKCV
jgi:hypothetical protein